MSLLLWENKGKSCSSFSFVFTGFGGEGGGFLQEVSHVDEKELPVKVG